MAEIYHLPAQRAEAQLRAATGARALADVVVQDCEAVRQAAHSHQPARRTSMD